MCDESPYSGQVPKTAENCVILRFLWLTIFKDVKDTCLCGTKMLEAIPSFLSAPSLVFLKTLRVASHPEGWGRGLSIPVSRPPCDRSRYTQSKLDASQREESDASGRGCEFEI